MNFVPGDLICCQIGGKDRVIFIIAAQPRPFGRNNEYYYSIEITQNYPVCLSWIQAPWYDERAVKVFY